MSDVFNDILAQDNASQVDVVAGAIQITDYDGKDGTNWKEVAYSLPEQYTEAQAQAFRVRMAGDETLQTNLCAGILWLSDGGYMEFDSPNDQWCYYPPVPPIPAFPNTGTVEDLHNDVVKRYFNLA